MQIISFRKSHTTRLLEAITYEDSSGDTYVAVMWYPWFQNSAHTITNTCAIENYVAQLKP